MRFDKIQHKEKHVDVLQDDAQVIFLEGTTNSGKSFILGEKMFWRVFNAPEEHTQFVLAGKSLPVIEKMYIQNQTSFYNIDAFNAVCQYKNSGIGGARIVVQTHTGEKIIYLLGYDNKKRWSDILGLTIHGFNIEEITQANEDFIGEVMLRVFRNGGWLICSSNGADPDSVAYVDHLNKCRPLKKWKYQVPKETWEELNRSEADERFRYYFFNFEDNPTMTEQQKTDLYETTPKGSYQWKTKIIGIRGIREGVIYANYMSREKNIIDLDMLNGNIDFLEKHGIELITLGQDVGGTDFNVIVLKVFTRNYKHVIDVDYFEINEVNHDELWEKFNKWFQPYYEKYGAYIKGDFIDSAAKIMRLTMDSRLKQHFNLRCYGAYKYTIVQRCDYGIALLSQGRKLFTNKTEPIYQSYTKAYYEEGNKTDVRGFNKHIHKDRVDASEYGEANYIAKMVKL